LPIRWKLYAVNDRHLGHGGLPAPLIGVSDPARKVPNAK